MIHMLLCLFIYHLKINRLFMKIAILEIFTIFILESYSITLKT